jgi:hypothetical protein
VASMRPAGWPAARQRVIGLPAPTEGFPKLDWELNTGEVALNFRAKSGTLP